MLERDDSKVAISLLQKHLQVQNGEPLEFSAADIRSLAELRELLTRQIAYMLDHQFERLVQAMYRIDIAEQDFRSVLVGEAPVAQALAELVLQRELKKVETRRLYSSV